MAQNKNINWISAEEQLPTDGEKYLAIARRKQPHEIRIDALYFNRPQKEWYGLSPDFEVVYWMPLPEIPDDCYE